MNEDAAAEYKHGQPNEPSLVEIITKMQQEILAQGKQLRDLSKHAKMLEDQVMELMERTDPAKIDRRLGSMLTQNVR